MSRLMRPSHSDTLLEQPQPALRVFTMTQKGLAELSYNQPQQQSQGQTHRNGNLPTAVATHRSYCVIVGFLKTHF